MDTKWLEQILPPQMVRGILEVVLILLLVSVVLLFFILVIHKLGTELKEKRRRRLRARSSASLQKFLLGRDGTVIRPGTKSDHEVLASLCIEKLEASSEEDKKVIRQYIRGTYLVDYYRKMASSSSMPKRFHAVKTLGYFALDELAMYFRDLLLEEKTDEVKGAVVWAMSRIADESTLDWITLTLSAEISLSSKFNEYVFSNVIRSFSRKGIIEKFPAFLEKLRDDESIPDILKRDVIEACGTSGLRIASKAIVDYYFDFDRHPANKIACLRALGRLGCPEFGGIVSSALFHEDWRVRAQAARASVSCSDSAVPHLRNLLYDDFYHVRINAARSLSRLGEKGRDLLMSERDSEDSFVRDTVRFMLRK